MDNNDGDYIEKYEKSGHLGKGSFLDKTQSPTLAIPEKTLLDISKAYTTLSPTLVTPEKTLLDTLEDDNPRMVTSDVGKKFTR